MTNNLNKRSANSTSKKVTVESLRRTADFVEEKLPTRESRRASTSSSKEIPTSSAKKTSKAVEEKLPTREKENLPVISKKTTLDNYKLISKSDKKNSNQKNDKKDSKVGRKRKKRLRLKKKPIFILLLILFVIFGGIYLFNHSNKYVFFKNLDDSYNELVGFTDNFVNKYFPYSNTNYYNNIDLSIDVLTSEVDSSINLNGDIYINNLDNYFDLSINSNKKLYNLKMLSKNDKLHFKVDDSKFYYSNLNVVSNKGFFDLLEAFVYSLKNNVKNRNLDKNNDKVIINSESYEVDKITLNIDNKLYKKTIKDFYNKIKDTDMIDVLFLFSNFESKEQMIKYLESDSLSLEDFFDENLKFSIYLYKDKIIKMEFVYGLNKSLSFVSYNDYIEFSIYSNENSSYLKIYNQKIDLFLYGIGYGKGYYTDSSFKIDFVDYYDNSLGNIYYSINKNNNVYLNEVDFNFDLSDIKLKMVLSSKIELDKKAPNIDTNNSVILDNITKNDKEILLEFLSEINVIFAF